MAKDSISRIIKNVETYKVLSAEETNTLAAKIQLMIALLNQLGLAGKIHEQIKKAEELGLEGDKKQVLKEGIAAREKLFLHNQRLVVHWASRFDSLKLDLEDLIQFGFEPLLTAVERFDPAAGYRFSTYAYYWVRSAISKERCLADSDFRITLDQTRRLFKISKARQEFRTLHQRKPDLQELSELSGLSVRSIKNTLKHNYSSGSLQADQESSDYWFSEDSVLDPGSDPIENLLAAEQYKESRDFVSDILSSLPPEISEIIRRHYLEGESIRDLSASLDLEPHKLRLLIKDNISYLSNKYSP